MSSISAFSSKSVLGTVAAGTLAILSACSAEDGAVTETARGSIGGVCGDGVRDACEICDDGDQNGQLGRCDTSCQFRCEGACPLRVDPAADPGSGSSWGDPMNDLQAALDRQGERGGGAVWVLGGSFPKLTNEALLLDLPSNVQLLGGFSGVETTPEQRLSTTPHTALGTAAQFYGGVPVQLRAIDRNNVYVDRVSVDRSDLALVIQGSRGVHIQDARFSSGLIQDASETRLSGSEVRFERVLFESVSVDLDQSKVAFVESNFIPKPGYYDFGGVFAWSSQLLFDRVLFAPDFLDSAESSYITYAEDSTLLILNSTLRGNATRSGGFGTQGGNLTVVGSHFTRLDGGAHTEPPISLSGTTLVFNSSFGELTPTWPDSPSIEAYGDFELAASTLYGNRCMPEESTCATLSARYAIMSRIHNSLFLDAEGPQRVPFDEADFESGNCSVASSGFQISPHPIGTVLASLPHPCANGGDAVELEAARSRLLTRAAPFAAEPFRADLSVYESPDWWRAQSNTAGECTDVNAPDPGRHYSLSCE